MPATCRGRSRNSHLYRFSRHAVTLWKLKDSDILAGYVDCPADMRNSNQSIALRLVQISGCPADMRKLNVCNGLRQCCCSRRG